jgi:AcrR family transcriptional regulator
VLVAFGIDAAALIRRPAASSGAPDNRPLNSAIADLSISGVLDLRSRVTSVLIESQEAMPATRPHLDRDLKRKQIVDAAEKLFLRDGYEATAMAAVARRAGVANNAVYWYFPSKDDLLAAMLQRRQERALAEMQPPTATLEEQVIALLAQLDRVANLTATVHERAKHSTAVAEMHEAFHGAADRLLKGMFQEAGLNGDDAIQAAKALMALVEGIHLHETDRDTKARNTLVLWTLRRLTFAA